MSADEKFQLLLVVTSMVCCTVGMATFATRVIESSTIFNRGDSSYSSLPTNAGESSEVSKLLWPRYRVWLHQICIFISLLLITKEVFDSCGSYPTMLCLEKTWHLVVIAVIDALSLFCDSLKKISSLSWKRKSVWIPTYAANAIYLAVHFISKKNYGSDTLNLACASLFAFVGLFFSITAAMAVKPKLLIYPATEEFTAGLLSYLTFSFINKSLIHVASNKGSLDLEDVPGLIDGDSCFQVYEVTAAADILHYSIPLCHRSL